MSKEILNMNSLVWLRNTNNIIKGSVLIGPPDIAEIGIDAVCDYYLFLSDVANLIMQKMSNEQYLIVIMTDRFWTENGCDIFIDKTRPFIEKALEHNFNLIFRKIIEVDNYNKKLPDHKLKTKYLNYSNIIVFKKGSCNFKISRQLLTTDIFRKSQEKLWIKGIFPNVVDDLMLFMKQNNVTHVSDFFSGHGTTLLLASKHNIDSFGIELIKENYEASLIAKL